MSLPGLRVSPYASYLAAHGLRCLVAEQVDPDCQGWWSAGHFHLRSRLDWEELLDFFCRGYAPTPIASPWNAGSGFYPGERSDAREAIVTSRDPRFSDYKDTLSIASRTIAELGLVDRPAGPEKERLLKALAAAYDDKGRRWLEAVVRINNEGLEYSPLFFTGGNDAKLEMSKTFQSCLHHLFLKEEPRDTRTSLLSLLCDKSGPTLLPQTFGALDPATTGSPNGSSVGESDPQGAPWSYVLALEGLLRLPLEVQRYHDPRGQVSLIPGEARRADLCLPLQENPAQSQPVHVRYAVLQRGGKAHFAIPVETRAGHRAPLPSLSHPNAHRRLHHLEDVGRLRLSDQHFGVDTLSQVECAELRLAVSLASRPGKAMGRGELCQALVQVVRADSRWDQRRRVRSQRAPRPARVVDLLQFLEGRTDDARLSRLLRAIPITSPIVSSKRPDQPACLLPLSYRIFKLAFSSRPDRRRRPPLDVLRMLWAGDFAAAWTMAVSFLQERHTWLRLPQPRDEVAPRRLAAALAFPLKPAYEEMLEPLRAVCHG